MRRGRLQFGREGLLQGYLGEMEEVGGESPGPSPLSRLEVESAGTQPYGAPCRSTRSRYGRAPTTRAGGNTTARGRRRATRARGQDARFGPGGRSGSRCRGRRGGLCVRLGLEPGHVGPDAPPRKLSSSLAPDLNRMRLVPPGAGRSVFSFSGRVRWSALRVPRPFPVLIGPCGLQSTAAANVRAHPARHRVSPPFSVMQAAYYALRTLYLGSESCRVFGKKIGKFAAFFSSLSTATLASLTPTRW